jgi:fumarate reductase subunit D
VRIPRGNAERVFAVLAVVILLVVANLVKDGYITATALKDQKDAISSVSTIISTVLLIIGAVVSYFRFFRGRTMAVRANVSIDVSVHTAQQDSRVHGVTIKMTNVGTSPIWNPAPVLSIQYHGEQKPHANVDEWDVTSRQNPQGTQFVIDSGETSEFFAYVRVPSRIEVVRYEAIVTCKSGETWQAARTVSNHEKTG